MESTASTGGAYGVQVLIAGRQKHWRDEVASQIRRAGYSATTVDSGVDAMTVLALGLPVDVLVTDADVRDEVDGFSLGAVARCLDPAVGVIYTTRSPRTLPAAIVAGAPCLRTPYHAHQLVSLIAGLPRPTVRGRGAARRAA